MKQSSNIKKSERILLIHFVNLFNYIKNFMKSFLKFIIKVNNQKITIMFIPHSEKKVFNFRINTFILFMFFFLSFGLIIGISFFSFKFFNNSFDELNANLAIKNIEEQSNEYQKMLNEILDCHTDFQSKLNDLITQLDSNTISAMRDNYISNYDKPVGGPLNRIDMIEMNELDKEKFMVRELLNDYQYSIQVFTEFNKMARVYKKLLMDLPFGSPVNGPYAITSGFGLRVHPLYHVLDMHQGIDLAYRAGTPIISTAPGVVEKVEWSPEGYGWYCKISHKLGFSTLYAHMRSRPTVEPGEKIQKGRLLGYMGSTGATTGTHLHYEIRLGDNLLDPAKFVAIY